jgi:hypothetical protein
VQNLFPERQKRRGVIEFLALYLTWRVYNNFAGEGYIEFTAVFEALNFFLNVYVQG